MKVTKSVKRCSHCKVKKSLCTFNRDQSKADGLACVCKECRKEYRHSSQGKAARKECNKRYRFTGYGQMARARAKKKERYRAFNITLDVYNEIFIGQKGCCALCGRHQNELKRAFCIDHDHKTGDVRGLLCGRCNTGLGMFRDDMRIIRKVISYLAK